MCRRWFILFWVLIGPTGYLVLSARSEETPPTPIQEAQVEFKALNKTRVLPGESIKIDLPKLSGPDTGVTIQSRSPLQRAKDVEQRKKAMRSENWLVDAMMKPDKSKYRDGTTADENNAHGDLLDPWGQLIREQSRDPRVEGRALADQTKTREELKDTVINPLNRFMSGWISSRDRELLLRDVAESDAAFSFSRFSDSTAPVLSLGEGNHKPTSAGMPRADLFRPASNPYLDLSGKNVIGSEKAAPQADPIPTNVTSPPSQLTPVSVPPRRQKEDLKPPGLANPEEAAHYFPQLKRF